MTIISRSQLDHPVLGALGGAGLHASIDTIYSKIGDNANSRYFEEEALGNLSSADFIHNFKADFDELTFLLYNLNTGSGELTRINAASTPAIGSFDIVATPGSLTTSVRVTNNAGSAQDLALIVLHSGGASAGGGGGGSLNWDEPPGLAPIKSSENGQVVYLYEPAKANKLVAFIKIPASHSPGSQLNMNIALYSPSTANNILMQGTSYLIRKDTDAIDSVANSHASTNSALTNSGVANKYQETTLDLTDGSGAINSITVQPGDMVKVELDRGTDTDTDDVRFIPNGTEVS